MTIAAKTPDNALVAGAVGAFLVTMTILKGLRVLLFLLFLVLVLAPFAEIRRLVLGDGAVLRTRRAGKSRLKSLLA